MKLLQDIEAAAHMWAYCIGFTGGVIAEAANMVVDKAVSTVATAVFNHLVGDAND